MGTFTVTSNTIQIAEILMIAFVAMVSAGWTLLHALVKNPIDKVREVVSQMSDKIIETEKNHLARISQLESNHSGLGHRLDRAEDRILSLEGRGH